jgi:hypothetical protein
MKRKQILFCVLIAAVALMVSSCWTMGPSIKGNGKVTEEVREVKNFESIKVSRGMNVYITQGSPASVEVIADNNLHEHIKTRVDGGVLEIFAEADIRRAEEKKVMVTVETLREISASTGSNVYSQNQFVADDLELSATTGSNLTMEVDAQNLEADCSTGSNIILSGMAKRAELKGSTGANLKGEQLKTGHCIMRASVGANVHATVSEQLEAKASTGGNIIYYGEPSSTDIENSTGGNVHRR